jgi:signal transduction histidine kinase
MAGINIRILTPADDSIKQTIHELESGQLAQKINIRLIEHSMQTKVSILVIDKKHSLVVELKDDTKKTSEEAVGLATYSNSKPTVLSYSSIFESLWKQIELYEQLQIHDNVQKEFINTAAHELRTPIQPIIGITDLLKGRIKDNTQKELLSVITRNAQRLKKLSEDILEVSKMESNSLYLNKEYFKINEIIYDNIHTYKNNSDTENIKFETILEDDISIYADKNSISRVISNLISNSIKFVHKEGGIISILAKRKAISEDNGIRKEIVVVSVKDNGEGIDAEIIPRLFTKFASKSFQGTGLGLYISKKIIESHGGKIWAENNSDGIGAIFSIFLPLQ